MIKTVSQKISYIFCRCILRVKDALHIRKTLLTAVVLSVMLIAFLSASVIVRAQNGNKSLDERIYYTNITVEKGDTLWNIAEEYMDYGHYDNIYEYMEHLTKLNHMTSDNLYAGEHLIVTYYASGEN